MNLVRRLRRTTLFLPALAILAACGSGGGGTGSSSSSSSSSSTQDIVAQAKARITELQTKGFGGQPPTSGPAAVPGKNVWVISCGDALESCSFEADAMMEAGKQIGWTMHRFDGNFDPVTAGNGIEQAIAAHADAIIAQAWDCPLIAGPLQKAKDAGVVTTDPSGLDCNDPALSSSSPALFTLQFPLNPAFHDHYSELANQYGADKADYAIAKTNGQAKVINIRTTDITILKVVGDAFATELKKCSGCSVLDTVDLSGNDLTNPATVEQKLANSLTQHPDANVVQVPTDGLYELGVSTALQQSGRKPELLVIGSEGDPTPLNLIRQGQIDTELAFDITWEAWGSIDALNRHFAKQPQVYDGQGWIVIDKDHNLPASGAWDGRADFKSAYKKIWHP